MKTQGDSNDNNSKNTKIIRRARSQDGKVRKVKPRRDEEESVEIKLYLNKLKDLVPIMPKEQKLSKLEVITYVIDYIRDLRQTLGLPPNLARNMSKSSPMDFDDDSSVDLLSMDSPLTSSSPSNLNLITATTHSPRQPLGVISTPNNGSLSSCASHEFPQLLDKSPSADVDTRPVSC